MAEGKCEVCKEGISKYKCPVCLIKFCCVTCFKSHKANELCVKHTKEVPSNSNNKIPEPQYEFETEDTVKPEKLRLLGLDRKLVKTLENPHLRNMIKHLDTTTDPAQGMEQAMKEPIFVEFVERCLKVVEGESSSDSDEDST